jgi:hypothetical protein
MAAADAAVNPPRHNPRNFLLSAFSIIPPGRIGEKFDKGFNIAAKNI